VGDRVALPRRRPDTAGSGVARLCVGDLEGMVPSYMILGSCAVSLPPADGGSKSTAVDADGTIAQYGGDVAGQRGS
jgi:hypothetical protein